MLKTLLFSWTFAISIPSFADDATIVADSAKKAEAAVMAAEAAGTSAQSLAAEKAAAVATLKIEIQKMEEVAVLAAKAHTAAKDAVRDSQQKVDAAKIALDAAITAKSDAIRVMNQAERDRDNAIADKVTARNASEADPADDLKRQAHLSAVDAAARAELALKDVAERLRSALSAEAAARAALDAATSDLNRATEIEIKNYDEERKVKSAIAAKMSGLATMELEAGAALESVKMTEMALQEARQRAAEKRTLARVDLIAKDVMQVRSEVSMKANKSELEAVERRVGVVEQDIATLRSSIDKLQRELAAQAFSMEDALKLNQLQRDVTLLIQSDDTTAGQLEELKTALEEIRKAKAAPPPKPRASAPPQYRVAPQQCGPQGCPQPVYRQSRIFSW